MNAAEDIDNKNDAPSKYFRMKVISEGTVYIEVVIPDEETLNKPPWRKIYEVIDKEFLNKQMGCLQKSLY